MSYINHNLRSAVKTSTYDEGGFSADLLILSHCMQSFFLHNMIRAQVQWSAQFIDETSITSDAFQPRILPVLVLMKCF